MSPSTVPLSQALSILGLLFLATSCGAPPRPKLPAAPPAQTMSPLGASYVLIPLPTEDDSMLGRVLLASPEPGRSIEETARPNPCVDKLEPAKATPLASTFEDAQDLGISGQARAMLGAFGFQGDVREASHFMYRLQTEKRVSRTDTTEYEACCKEQQCGYGYVSALIYGTGEYATGQEIQASAGANVVIASGSGSVGLRVLHRRNVRGYVAALIALTDKAKGAEALGPLGVAQVAGITETTVPDAVKQIYETEKLHVETGASAEAYQIKDQRGPATENEFVRRYRAVTESNELDEYEFRRQPGAFYGGIAVLGLGVASLGLTIGVEAGVGDILFNRQNADANKGWIAPIIMSSVCAMMCSIVGGVSFGVSSYDGDSTDHALSEREARIYVEKYNRALLRRTIRDVQQSHREPIAWVLRQHAPVAQTLRLKPFTTPGFWGVEGTF